MTRITPTPNAAQDSIAELKDAESGNAKDAFAVSGNSPTLDIARAYTERGWSVIPIPHKQKKAYIDSWQKLRLTLNDLPSYFNSKPQNIGVLLGEPSVRLVDVDLDCEEAVQFAPHFLPKTHSIFGHPSKPKSHYLYISDCHTKKFQDPTRKENAMIVELRSTGCQTVMPGSMHPSGEQIKWYENGESAQVESAALLNAVERLSQAVLLARGVITKQDAGGSDSHFNTSSTSPPYITEHDPNADLKELIMSRGKRNSYGNYDIPCPAHHGKGSTSLFYNPITGAFKCNAGCTTAEIRRAFGLPETNRKVKRENDGEADESKGKDNRPNEIDVCMADVEPQEVEWLVEPYIPLGKLTLVEGDPDEGKSFATLAIATAVTNGGGLPFSDIEEAGNVLLLSAEDGRADTIRPRLDLLGADVSHVFAVKTPLVLNEKGFEQLEGLIVKRGATLVVIDPLFAYVGGQTDINQDNKVRAITTRLADIAERRRCAIVALRHLSKAEQRNAKMAGSSSIAWTAAARSVLLFGHEPGDEDAKGFIHTKHNLSRAGMAQGYRIDDVGGKPRFRWTGECSLTAEQILGSQNSSGTSSPEVSRAEDLLFQILQGGAVQQREIERRAKRERISIATLRRAKKNLGVKSYREGSNGAWLWKLPDAQGTPDTADEHVGEGAEVDTTKAISGAIPDAQVSMWGKEARRSNEHVESLTQSIDTKALKALNPDAHSGCVGIDEHVECSDARVEVTEREYEWQERAAIMEYDGGLSRDEAERLATMGSPIELPKAA